MSAPQSDPPRRYPKASEWIREHADRLFGNWGGDKQTNALERLRLALRSRQAASEAYQDEEQQRREAFERDVLQRLKRVEDMAHQPYDFSHLVRRLDALEKGKRP